MFFIYDNFAMYRYPSDDVIGNLLFSLEYVKCMIADNTNPSAIAKSCAEKLAIRFNDIQE
jgi:hypothetical protein